MYIDKMLEYLCLVNLLRNMPDWVKTEYARGEKTTFSFGHGLKEYDLSEMNSRLYKLQDELLEPYVINSDSRE